jgi:hypothetical protein
VVENKFKIEYATVCKDKFEAKYFLQKTCFDPSCILEYKNKVKAKEWKAEKKVLKEKLKTYSDHVKELQVIVNKYVRLRDKDKGCISCGTPLTGKYDAGHYTWTMCILQSAQTWSITRLHRKATK